MVNSITRSLTALFVVCLLGLAPVANAQFIEIVAGYLINRELARSQTREVTAGKIVCNVWLEEGQGKLRQLPGWDPTTQTSTYWSDDVVLEPVVIINGSNSPREIQWAISDVRGPLRKIQYNPVNGGRRGQSGGAKDNGGFKYDSPMISVRDLPKGWFALHASWGKGQSATIQAQRFSIRDFMPYIDDPLTMEALAGAGQSTYPITPVFTGRMPDGQICFFNSAEEFHLAVKRLNDSAKKEVVEVSEPRETKSPPEQPKKSRSSIEIFATPYGNEIQALARKEGAEKAHLELANRALDAGLWTSNELPIVEGQGLAILIFSKEKMTVELKSAAKQPVVVKTDTNEGLVWSCLIPLTIKSEGKPTNTLVIQAGNDKRELRFRKEKK